MTHDSSLYIGLLIGVALAALLFNPKVRDFLGFLWFLTGGVWFEVFKSQPPSTGNGAGMGSSLICMAVISCQVVVVVVGGLVWLAWRIMS